MQNYAHYMTKELKKTSVSPLVQEQYSNKIQ